jgi:hypothetical protein
MGTALGIGAVLAGCAVMVAPAGVASADQTAIETIGLLEAQGYTVNIDRVGSAPLSECIVTSVRNPQTVTRLIRVDNGRGHRGDHDFDLVPVVVSRSISVSLNCTG